MEMQELLAGDMITALYPEFDCDMFDDGRYVVGVKLNNNTPAPWVQFSAVRLGVGDGRQIMSGVYSSMQKHPGFKSSMTEMEAAAAFLCMVMHVGRTEEDGLVAIANWIADTEPGSVGCVVESTILSNEAMRLDRVCFVHKNDLRTVTIN